MKFFNIPLLFIVFALICTALAQDDAAGPKRIALRRPVGKSAKTTTTTPAPAEEEGDYPDDNLDNQYGDEGEGEDTNSGASTTTTSTEPPKKVGPVIRPFRSNDDFLNSLKRRQQESKKHRNEKPTIKSKPAPAAEEGDEAEESAPAPAPAPSKIFKSSNPALNRRKFTKPGKPEPVEDATAEESEQPKEETNAKRPLSPRLALRRRS